MAGNSVLLTCYFIFVGQSDRNPSFMMTKGLTLLMEAESQFPLLFFTQRCLETNVLKIESCTIFEVRAMMGKREQTAEV